LVWQFPWGLPTEKWWDTPPSPPLELYSEQTLCFVAARLFVLLLLTIIINNGIGGIKK